MNYIELHFSNDGFMALTIDGWIELLDEYTLDEVHYLFYSIFYPITKAKLKPYLRDRMIKSKKT